MQIIKHRVNNITDLDIIDPNMGVEIDVRYHNNDLILHHDPFNHHISENVTLKEFVKTYTKNFTGTIILNIKTEGIEPECIDIMAEYKYTNWFFLDLSMPMLIKFANNLENLENINSNNLCTRFSEYENIESVILYQDKVSWVWVDCFHSLPLTKDSFQQIHNSHQKICVVSPELQNRDKSEIHSFKDKIRKNNFIINAVCTKHPELWQAS